MFLALKEMKHEKLRYGLIIGMIVLISYLIFILTSLALGLARENTDAIDSWGMNSIVLTKDANISLDASLITTTDAPPSLAASQAYLGEAAITVKAAGHSRLSGTFIGVSAASFVRHNVRLTAGHWATRSHEVVADTALQESGYRLGSKIKLNSDTKAFTIVGFTHNAKMTVAPVLYGQLGDWRGLKGVMTGAIASAIVSTKAQQTVKSKALKSYPKAAFIQELPGYSAQNMTFELMIGFLFIISLIVIAVFLYILTMQKLPNYAVLRAQGIPSRLLVASTLAQALVMVVSGVVIGVILTVLTAAALPSAVPMAFDVPILTAVGLGLVIMAVLGALIPVRQVLRVDPVSVIGG